MAERDLGGPASQRAGPQGTHDVPENNGPAARGVIQAVIQGPGHRTGLGAGPGTGPKLERVEFPAGCHLYDGPSASQRGKEET